MRFINYFSIILLINDVTGQEEKPLGKGQLISAGQVRNLFEKTVGKIFNKPVPTKVSTSKTVLNKTPAKTYTTTRPRKHVTTQRQHTTTRQYVTTRQYTTQTPLNGLVTVATTGDVSVLDTLKDDEQFSTLVVALEKAGITAEGLDKISPLTIFAPTNSAFAKIPTATLTALLEDKPSLSSILLRHVLPEAALRIPAGRTDVQTASGDSLSIQRSLDDIYSESIVVNSSQGSAKITKLDITAEDGVIFAIDTVI
jgi:uncharacterized surface protein with fasciclin (FAS1) repeats